MLFIEVFAGTAGLSVAVLRAGIELVKSWDIKIDKRHDLLHEENVKTFFKALQDPCLLAVWFGTPCNTLSPARRDDGGPPPLRSDSFPKGLPNLSEHDQQRVDEANQLATVTAMGMEIAFANRAATVLENPCRSRLWRLKRIITALARIGAILIQLDYCSFGAPWQKRTTLAGTLKGLSKLAIL